MREACHHPVSESCGGLLSSLVHYEAEALKILSDVTGRYEGGLFEISEKLTQRLEHLWEDCDSRMKTFDFESGSHDPRYDDLKRQIRKTIEIMGALQNLLAACRQKIRETLDQLPSPLALASLAAPVPEEPMILERSV